MKTGKILAIIWLAAFCPAVYGQTKNPYSAGSSYKKPTYQPKAEDFRVVDGKTYNIILSTNWNSLTGEVKRVSDGVARLKTFTTVPIYEASMETGWSYDGLGNGTRVLKPTQVKVGENKEWGREVALKNQPRPEVGQTHSIKAMLVGTTNIDGVEIELWDVGIPPTKPGENTATKVATPKPKRRITQEIHDFLTLKQ